MSVRAEPRTTRDLDLAIAVDSDKDAESLVRDLRARGYADAASPLHQTRTDRLATVRLRSTGQADEGIVVDLMFANSGIEREVVEVAESLEVLPGVSVRVARLGHLLALKILANRQQDVADAESLCRNASDDDLEMCRRALELISRRGYDRGLELQKLLNELIAKLNRPAE